MSNRVNDILVKKELDGSDIITLLSLTDEKDLEQLRAAAEAKLLAERGDAVFFRGLIEFSNICTADCYYCGIRSSNYAVGRYQLTEHQMVDAALWCAHEGYGSIVLQSGERRDAAFVDFVERVVGAIKAQSRSSVLPDGLGITLCVGEQCEESYRRFFAAGAHRYLLRIESTSETLFSRIHPPAQKLSDRISCLKVLKRIGYLVGTGVMIGLPGQKIEDLARDILFFRKQGIDMIGMGPYIVHSQTPLAAEAHRYGMAPDDAFILSLKMIAVTRLVLHNVNIAATTALQSIKHDGREWGLRYGANVVMPQLTPTEVRKEYSLYEGKPCVDENSEQCRSCLTRRIESVGRVVASNVWGDREC